MSETSLESAIPEHLRRSRGCPRRIGDGFTPPYPSYVARYGQSVGQVVMAFFGIQYRGDRPASVTRSLEWLGHAFSAENGPHTFDRAEFADTAGFANVICSAYWTSPDQHTRWMQAIGEDWIAPHRAEDGIGCFLEIVRPTVDRFETLFSAPNRREAVGLAAEAMSSEIEEHGYWGGVRDRIPLGQNDAMRATGELAVRHVDGVDRVTGTENLCLIRSGQDWTDAGSQEREMYSRDVEPSLRAGMDFLAGEGRTIGCLSNRYATVVDRFGNPLDKTFGMSWWRGLDDLERWAESHPTHLAIFGAALRTLGVVGSAAELKLYHEVSVIPASEQRFEYRNCHPMTGLLSVAGSVVRGDNSGQY